jgi:hypothetical protein
MPQDPIPPDVTRATHGLKSTPQELSFLQREESFLQTD